MAERSLAETKSRFTTWIDDWENFIVPPEEKRRDCLAKTGDYDGM